MWDYILVIAVILVVKYLMSGGGGGAAIATAPPADSTMEILNKATVVKRDRSSKALSEVLKNCDIVLVYFSAHWCPPCRMFTPVLADVYKQLTSQGKKVEVVFVSSDKSEGDMYSYMEEAHGDWYSIKFDDAARSELSKHFGIRGIPTLIVLKGNGKVVSLDGRSEVQSKGAQAWDTWMQA